MPLSRRFAPIAVALLAFALAALPAFGVWWLTGRPLAIPYGAPGKIPCVSYTPFRVGQTPFDETLVVARAWIEEDLKRLAERVSCVRTYAVDQGLDAVPEIAATLGLKVLLGAWIGREHDKNQHQIATAIRLANAHPGTVRALIVGNEVLLRREQSAARLADYLRAAKAATAVPVTYADVWEFWLTNIELAQAVDFITIHILPYWEDRPIANRAAAAYVRAVWEHFRTAFPGKPVLVGEVGWPSAGRMRAGARPGAVNQARFARELSALAAATPGLDYNLIEAFDQPWKRALEGTVGGHWGLYDADRRAKFPWTGPVAENPAWRTHFLVGLGIAALLLAAVAYRNPPLMARPSAARWFALAFAAHAAGGVLVQQALHMIESSRSPIEWAVGAGGIVVSAATAWLTLLLLILGRAAPQPLSVRRVLDWLQRPRLVDAGLALWLGLLQACVMVAASAHTLALIFDARYRGFPVASFLIPAVAFAALAWRTRRAEPAPLDGREKGETREEIALAGVIALGTVAVVAIEGLRNDQALAWAAVAGLLATPWLAGAWRRQAAMRTLA